MLIISELTLWFEPQTDHQRKVFSNEDLFFLDSTMLLIFNRLRSSLRAIENMNGPHQAIHTKGNKSQRNIKGDGNAQWRN